MLSPRCARDCIVKRHSDDWLFLLSCHYMLLRAYPNNPAARRAIKPQAK